MVTLHYNKPSIFMDLQVKAKYHILVSPVALNRVGISNMMPTPELFEAEWDGTIFNIPNTDLQFSLSDLHGEPTPARQIS